MGQGLGTPALGLQGEDEGLQPAVPRLPQSRAVLSWWVDFHGGIHCFAILENVKAQGA